VRCLGHFSKELLLCLHEWLGITGILSLYAGPYKYFCPLNPTEKYSLTVIDNLQTLRFTQVPGDFVEKGIIVTSGSYSSKFLTME